MLVGEARSIATRWVHEAGAHTPGFRGAYLAGSINTMDDSAELAPWSDVDIMVVVDEPPDTKLGKMIHDGALLEVTYLPWSDFTSCEAILGRYHLAASFQSPAIVADPAGDLTRLQQAVAQEFPRRRWVEGRCAQAREVVFRGLESLPVAASLPHQVIAWAFPTAVMTHILLVAGLKNPTVRTRYEKTRALLAEHDELDLYEPLLDLLGCGSLSREHVEGHLQGMVDAFDRATSVEGAPFPFASDITLLARPIAVDGSQDLIERELHREAVFWIVATWSRSLQILDWAGRSAEGNLAGYCDMLADLGIASFADMRRHAERALALLPTVDAAATRIMDRNPSITK